MSTSYWLYIHPELSNKENYWKVGKSLTPYSAVRSRQRFLVDDFYLTAVWFGHPDDIALLEAEIHRMFRPVVWNKLGSSRGELVYFNPEHETETLEQTIDAVITVNEYRVRRIVAPSPRGYHATNASQCPYGCAQEKDAHKWSRAKLRELKLMNVSLQDNHFDSLFEYSS